MSFDETNVSKLRQKLSDQPLSHVTAKLRSYRVVEHTAKTTLFPVILKAVQQEAFDQFFKHLSISMLNDVA